MCISWKICICVRKGKKVRILFVVGSCLKSNSSANLCHMAYIKGAIENGYQVEVLSVSDKDVPVDTGIKLPEEIKWINYDSALYTRCSYKKSLKNAQSTEVVKSGNNATIDITSSASGVKNIIRKMKNKYIESMGIFGFDTPWIKRATRFKNSEKYDMVISLAWPPASHEAARILIEKKRIQTECWCQIWEDPWYLDLWMDKDIRKYETEKRLISSADKVMYVSPITLKYQKEAFPEYADKMFWEPLPFYYINNETEEKAMKDDLLFGYYGDYHIHIRNLEPFYKAAKNLKIRVNIYGNPTGMFEETEKIDIKPRVSLDVVKQAEKETDVLVFVCNVKGGQIPGKLYQYSSTKKWILFILDGTEEEMKEIERYYQKYQRYVFCKNNIRDIEKAIGSIVNNKIEGVNNNPIKDFYPKNIFGEIVYSCQKNPEL